jgi:hypothetical protein
MPTVKLSKKQRKALVDYLEDAHASQIHGTQWTTKWSSLHGEGRSSSSITFHINIMKTSGKAPVYRAAIASGSKANNVVDGTLLEFDEEPDLGHILNQYKRMYGVEVSTPTDGSDDDDDDD